MTDKKTSRKNLASFLFLLTIAFAFASTLRAGDQDEKQPGMDAESVAQMNAWMAHATPGEHHSHLEYFAGTWDAQCKFWMAPGEPQEATSQAKAELVMGGRFLITKWSGDSPFGPMPFEGMEVLGYDNTLKKYQGVWIDNMTTSQTFMEGTCDPSGKVFKYTGLYVDPLKPDKRIKTRGTVTVINDSKYKYESFELQDDGSERKAMEIVAERKKG